MVCRMGQPSCSKTSVPRCGKRRWAGRGELAHRDRQAAGADTCWYIRAQMFFFTPQIGYRTVFFWEYFGPLVIFPLFYLLPHIFYPGFK